MLEKKTWEFSLGVKCGSLHSPPELTTLRTRALGEAEEYLCLGQIQLLLVGTL